MNELVKSKYQITKLGKHIFEEKESTGDSNGSNYPVYGVTNIGGVIETGKETSKDLSKYKRLKPNRFVYNPYRINVGSVGLSNEDQNGIVSPAYVIFGTRDSLFSKYLYYYLKSDRGNTLIRYYGNRGTVRSALRFSDLCKIVIPLPSPDVQKRIVAEIESLMRRIEEARKLRKQTIEEYEELIERIHSNTFEEVSEKHGTAHIQQIEVDMNNENIDPKKKFGNNPFIYLDVSSVEQKTGAILERKEILGINAPSRARRKMRKGDVVFSAVRPYLKKCFIVDRKLDGNICSTGFTVFRIKNNKIDPKFLKYQLLSNYFIDQCVDAVTGSHYPALNDKNMKKLKLTIPSISEQRRIVAYLHSLQEKVNKLRKLQNETKKEIGELVPAILDKAFRGEL